MGQGNIGNVEVRKTDGNDNSGNAWARTSMYVSFTAGTTEKVSGAYLSLGDCDASSKSVWEAKILNSSDETVANLTYNGSLYCGMSTLLHSVDSSDGFVTLEKGGNI